MKILTDGLRFPEGPVALDDGSVIVCDIEAGRVTRVSPDGTKETVAETGGGPNGAALGPDGRLYVCNSGGFAFSDMGGLLVPGDHAPDHAGGSIQVVELSSGRVETLYTHCGEVTLNSPNDWVFDAQGGFYFTDFGRSMNRRRDHGVVYYAYPDGRHIREVIYPLITPNGIGLSPDGTKLIVAESYTGRLWGFDLVAPGETAPRSPLDPGHLLYNHAGYRVFDSLAVAQDGHVCVGSCVEGGITVVDPEAGRAHLVAMEDPLVTNLCFGGEDRRTAFVCLSASGRLGLTGLGVAGLALHGAT